MQRLVFATWLLIFSIILSGCARKEVSYLYIYCNETFWYALQEQSIYFNKIYGFHVILIPVRAERSTSKEECETVEIGINHAPAPWRSMPREDHASRSASSLVPINPAIEEQIDRIAKEQFGDMFLSDSTWQIDKLREKALSTNEYVICYLTLTMLVPKDNPYQFRSVKDVLNTHRRLGIVNPSFDGLGESSWHILKKIVPEGESGIPRELVQFYDRQYDLLEALEQGDIDAALVWDSTSLLGFLLDKYGNQYNAQYENILKEAQKKNDAAGLRSVLNEICQIILENHHFAEPVSISKNSEERHVTAIHLVVLTSTINYGFCERFVDYLRSKQGKSVLQRFGFKTE